MNIPESIRTIVGAGPLAHFTTLNADGSPQTSLVWIGLEGEEFVMGHMGKWKKVANVERDGRVTLSFLGPDVNEMGLREYVVVGGDAYVTEGGAADLLQRLARVYMGPDVEFPPEPYRSNPGFVTHVTPRRFSGVGPWNEGQK